MGAESKVALVTGVTGQFGRGVASELAARGWRVVGTGRRAERGRLFEKGIHDAGGEAVFVPGDVSKVDDCHRFAECAVAAYGRIDLLVNNAGTATDPLFIASHEVTEEQWDRVLGTNLKGAFFCAMAALPTMIEQRSGNIINIASTAGKNVGPTRQAAYMASKAGLISLTKTLAVEYADTGIRVNSIVLGAAEGEVRYRDQDLRGRAALGEKYVASDYDDRNNGGITGQALAATIAYLASGAANYINGAAIAVDNGLTAGNYWKWVEAGKQSPAQEQSTS
jgi:NAD(P)-dependent dehydrogenase (short-subunit alcohol dehydrogenase family)